ncbi:hypothetical protein LC593_10850 [Nostoc sp. CHAB 5844]|nr:hypothetical protein [Nostoc sp. CHAB 5844]
MYFRVWGVIPKKSDRATARTVMCDRTKTVNCLIALPQSLGRHNIQRGDQQCQNPKN